MSSDVKPTEVLDVRGEVCPYPDVKTQKKVKSMKSGEVLEVLVDYPLSAICTNCNRFSVICVAGCDLTILQFPYKRSGSGYGRAGVGLIRLAHG